MKNNQFCTIFLAIALVATASAADVSWTGSGDGTSWSDPNNWSTGVMPTSADNVLYPNTSVNWDLGGVVRQIASLNYAAAGSGSTWTFSNGTLEVLSGKSTIAKGNNVVLNGANITFGSSSTVYFSENQWDSQRVTVTIKANSAFKVDGQYHPRRVDFVVENGGTFIYGKSTKLNNCNVNSLWTITNNGTLELESGITGFNDAWSAPGKFIQNAGTLIIGGPIKTTNNIYWRFELNGGKVIATDNVTFANQGNGYTKFGDGADVVIETAAGKTLDMSNFTYDGDAKVTLEGTGSTALNSLPSHLVLNGASLAVETIGAYSEKVAIDSATSVLTVKALNVHFGELESFNGQINIAAAGLQIDTVASSVDLSSGTFSCEGLNYEEVVLVSSNAALLAKAKSDLQLLGIATVIENGNTLKIPPNEVAFTSTTVRNFNDPTGWLSGSVPQAGVDVKITGAGVNAVISSAINNYSEISIEDGATLEVQYNVNLPKIRVASNSKLIIRENTSVTLGELLTKADDESLAVFEIKEGAIVQTAQPFVAFSDMHLKLYGTIQNTAPNATFHFGYANTLPSKFAMDSDGGSVVNGSSSGESTPSITTIGFACAEQGGTVEIPNGYAINIKDTSLPKACFKFCEGNNIESEIPINVIGTAMTAGVSTSHNFAGTSKVTFSSGACFKKPDPSSPQSDATIFNICDSAKVILDSGSYMYIPVCGNWNGGGIKLNPANAGYECLTINEGAYAYIFNDQGTSDKAVVAMNGGAWDMRYKDWWGNHRLQTAFKNIATVSIAEDTTCVIRRAKGTGTQNNSTHYEGAYMTNVVYNATTFVGKGNLCIDNTYSGKKFAAVMMSSGNTCTGDAWANGENGATLLFNDGSNWSGKVIANGALGIVNGELHSADFIQRNEPATVTFGGLELQQDFPIRIWKEGSGKTATITNDTINVGSMGYSGTGVLKLVLSNENSIDKLERFPLGTLSKNAELPNVMRGYRAGVREIPGDDENVLVMIWPNTGTTIIFR